VRLRGGEEERTAVAGADTTGDQSPVLFVALDLVGDDVFSGGLCDIAISRRGERELDAEEMGVCCDSEETRVAMPSMWRPGSGVSMRVHFNP